MDKQTLEWINNGPKELQKEVKGVIETLETKKANAKARKAANAAKTKLRLEANALEAKVTKLDGIYAKVTSEGLEFSNFDLVKSQIVSRIEEIRNEVPKIVRVKKSK